MATDNILVLSDLTADYNQFKEQFTNWLSNKSAWKGTLTTQTSTTLIDMVSSLGTFAQSELIRAKEDLFSETAQSDDAIRSITQMQGLRTTRKLPSTLQADVLCPYDATLAPLTQFNIGGSYWFSRSQITLQAGVPLNTTLYQGAVQNFVMNGEGTNNQTWVSNEDNFAVSDQDVMVLRNNQIVPKMYGGLWNNKDQLAYQDATMPNGSLLVIFGSNRYGLVPQTNDVIVIRYPVTNGASANNQALIDTAVTVNGFPDITGTVTANPTGGADEQSVVVYKNLGAGSAGTFSSAVTPGQYVATVGIYPGIQDSITQAQREINPSALEWMNVIRVAPLTNSPWSAQQKADYLKYLQSVTMYAPRFVWVDPVEVPRDVVIELYCFNSAVLDAVKAQAEEALTDLFARKPGILLTNFYQTDLDTCVKKATNGAISYTIIRNPTEPMLVTAPESPTMYAELLPGGGVLPTYVYQYGMSSINALGEEGPPTNWISQQVVSPGNNMAINLTWTSIPGAIAYRLYGRRSGEIGLIAEIPAGQLLTFLDDGTITPSGGPPNTLSEVPIKYNSLRSLQVVARYAERQQRIGGLDIS